MKIRSTKENRAAAKPTQGVPVQRANVAGIDLGSREHWVCGPCSLDGKPNVRTFGTTTLQLDFLATWLADQQVVSVAMESTGVYWIPLYDLLESRGVEVVLVNAHELKTVPGRKTDMKDCQWLQQLHSCGLLRGSFRPAEQICALRALHRHQQNLIAERIKTVQWIQKELTQMNIQVHHAVTDITGKTGMAIIRAILDGERDPDTLAALRDRRCRKSAAQIAEHLTGNWRFEHLFNLEAAVEHYDFLEGLLARYQDRLNQELKALQPPERAEQPAPSPTKPAKDKSMRRRGEKPTHEALWRFSGVDLTQIDGISVNAATTILTEVGHDVSRFPSERQFISWLRLSPRVAVSGGKPLRKKRNGTGATRISKVLRVAAMSLSRAQSALGAHYRRIARRKSGSIAVFATARKLAVLVYRMLKYGQQYVDIGAAAYERLRKDKRLAAIRKSAREFGYQLVPATKPTEPDPVPQPAQLTLL